MIKYILITEQEKEIINEFNKNGYYLSVICSTKWGDVIVDNLDEPGYEILGQQMLNSKRFAVDEKGELLYGLVPEEVQLWRLRSVLKISGLFSNVENAINNLPESNADQIKLKIAAKEGWEYSNYVTRQSQITVLIQQILNLSDAQVDQIFENANTLI